MNTLPSTELDSMTKGFTLSVSITLFFNFILMVAKEQYPPLLALMKNISILGIKHHWMVHGLVLLFVFFLLGGLFTKMKLPFKDTFLVKFLILSFVLSSSGIVVFFLQEFFSK